MACLPCIFLPALLAGTAGMSGIEAARKKKLLMWIFITLSIIILGLWIFFRIKKMKCKTCKFTNKRGNE